MTKPELPVTAAKTERRVQAVLALFQGEAVADVCGQYQIGRSDLYKYRHRALTAIRAALTDHPRGPRQPANHLSSRQEAQIVTLCQQHPTWSARAIQAHYGVDAPSLRTIQRVRARHGLVHALKRPPALATGHRLTPAEPSAGPRAPGGETLSRPRAGGLGLAEWRWHTAEPVDGEVLPTASPCGGGAPSPGLPAPSSVAAV